MKRIFYFQLFLLLSIATTRAQNWQAFNPSYIYHYQLNNDTILHSHYMVSERDSAGVKIYKPNNWLKIDSYVVTKTPFKTWQDSIPILRAKHGYKLVARDVLSSYSTKNGKCKLHSKTLDVHFSNVNGGFVYSKNGDSIFLKKYGYENLLDTIDSVKVFANTAERFVVSRNFGLLVYQNFKDSIHIELKGIQKVAGVQKLSWNELISHDVGDSLDYRGFNDYYYSHYKDYTKEDYRLLVLERREYNDSLVLIYRRRIRRNRSYSDAGEPTRKYLKTFTDTLVQIHYRKDLLRIVNEDIEGDFFNQGQLIKDTIITQEFDIDGWSETNYYSTGLGLFSNYFSQPIDIWGHSKGTELMAGYIAGLKYGDEFFPDSTFDMSGKSSTDNPSNVFDIYVYPNPSKIFNLEFSNEIKADLLVFNSAGKQVLSVSDASNKYQLDMSAYNSGLYFIEIRSEQGVARKKLMVR